MLKSSPFRNSGLSLLRAWSMHMRSFMIGSTVETSRANPVLHELIASFASQTFRILLMRIPVHAFRQASMSMIGLCFSTFSVPAIFSVGDMISVFQVSGMQPPCSAAFAMSRYDSSTSSGASLSMSVVTPLSPGAFPFATFFQCRDHSSFEMGMIFPSPPVTIPV